MNESPSPAGFDEFVGKLKAAWDPSVGNPTEALAYAAFRVANDGGVERNRLMQLASQVPRPAFEYRPLPPYGTPEFAAEIERRLRNPGRLMSIEESMSDDTEG